MTFSGLSINLAIANPARGQLNRENEYLHIPVCVIGFGLARQVSLSSPASPCSFSTPMLNLIFPHRLLPFLPLSVTKVSKMSKVSQVSMFTFSSNRFRANLMRSRSYVPMAFVADGLPVRSP